MDLLLNYFLAHSPSIGELGRWCTIPILCFPYLTVSSMTRRKKKKGIVSVQARHSSDVSLEE